MRLSSSTLLFGDNGKGFPTKYTNIIECLHCCKAAGFAIIDMNFSPMANDLSEFAENHWMREIYKVKEEAERLGLVFNQSHLPLYPNLSIIPATDQLEYYTNFMEWTRRSIIGSGILGVKWAVAHPYTLTDSYEYNLEANIKMNLEFYRPLLSLAKIHNIGLAFENMLEQHQPKVVHRFCTTADELIQLVDSFDDANVGICWDFGHANLMYDNQEYLLRKIGKRLKATHVSDNHGNYDSHMPPFIGGSVQWKNIIPLLSEIGYVGDLSLEIKSMSNSMPDILKEKAARLTFHAGQYLLSLIKE